MCATFPETYWFSLAWIIPAAISQVSPNRQKFRARFTRPARLNQLYRVEEFQKNVNNARNCSLTNSFSTHARYRGCDFRIDDVSPFSKFRYSNIVASEIPSGPFEIVHLFSDSKWMVYSIESNLGGNTFSQPAYFLFADFYANSRFREDNWKSRYRIFRSLIKYRCILNILYIFCPVFHRKIRSLIKRKKQCNKNIQ